MNALRRLADDLVEKRLWPIALLLVVALVAIPLVLGRGSAPGSDRAPVVTPAVESTANATPAVVLVGPPAVRSRPGKLRDPFRRKKVAAPKSDATAAPAAKKVAAKGDATTGGASTPKSTRSTKSSAPSKPKATPPPAPLADSLASRSVYEVAAHFSGGAFDYEHELARLSILGAKDNPALQYIGVSRGGEYAIFLLAPGAIAAGDDGACIIADSCRAIGLRKGDKLEVQVARTGTGPLHYKLELTSLRRVARTTKAAAQRDRSRVASGGREALHGLSKDLPTAAALGQLRYGPASGTVALVRAP